MTPLPVHPYAHILPRMSEGEYAALRENVRTLGRLIDPIVLLEGKVLDGRHRDAICCELGTIERRTVEFKASWGSPIEYVYAKACHRHMSDTQKACAGVGIVEARESEAKAISAENLKRGKNATSEKPTPIGRSAELAAGMFGVSARYVVLARWLKTQDAKLFQEALQGRTTLSRAQSEVRRELKRKMMAKPTATPLLPNAGRWHYAVQDVCEGLAAMPRSIARLIFADPPYNIGIDYGTGKKADQMPDGIFVEWLSAWIAEAEPVLTKDGSLWVLISDEFAAELVVAAKKAGLHLRRWICWYETFGTNCSDNFNRTKRHLLYFTKHRDVWIFNHDAVNRPSDRQAKYQDSRANPAGKNWDDIWGINPAIPRLVDNSAERLPDFPTQLPKALLTPIVGVASHPGDLVVDCFAGSGSMLDAAVSLGRHAIGFDAGQRFAKPARQRLAKVGRESSIDQIIQEVAR